MEDTKAAEYRKKYEQKRAKKIVSFNLDKENEKELFDFSNKLDFSKWAKEKLNEEMEKNKK